MQVAGFLSHTGALICLVVALLSGVLAVFREVQMMYFPPKSPNKKVFWAFVRIAFGIALVLLYADEHTKVSQLEGEAVVVSLDCERIYQPAAFVDNKLFILTPTMKGGLAILGAAPGQSYYPETPPTQKCSVVNYGSTNIFQMLMLLKSEKLEVIRNGKEFKSGGVLDSFDHPILVPELGGNGGRFTFYIFNYSDYYIRTTAPDFVTIELGNERKRQRADLRISGFYFVNREIFLEPFKLPSSR